MKLWLNHSLNARKGLLLERIFKEGSVIVTQLKRLHDALRHDHVVNQGLLDRGIDSGALLSKV